LTLQGCEIADKILEMLAMRFPGLVIPYIPDIVALMLHFMSKEEAFFTACSLVEYSRTDSFYFITSAQGPRLFLLVFRELVKIYVRPLFNHISDLVIDMADFAVNWFERLFIGVLPYQTGLTIIDNYLVSGSKVLYRAALAILTLCTPELLQTNNEEDFMYALNANCALITPEDMLKVIFQFPVKKKRYCRPK